MKIQTSTSKDIPEIFRLYALATAYQKTVFPENTWPTFKETLIDAEIKEQRQFKMVIDGQIACVWAITFTDPQIWEERDRDPSIYIHRIATNPEFRGQGFVSEIVKWAMGYSKKHRKKFIRMDTCGNNRKLIEYYTKCGFEFLGSGRLKCADELPTHYQNVDVCLFELQLVKG